MDTDVLIVGGGPVGLTAALELRRRDIAVRVIDRLEHPAGVAKAVGVQPRTVELWDAAGIARPALDAAITMRGAIVYRDGVEKSRMDLHLPDTVAYRFISLPQYETERILAEELARFGTRVERGVELTTLTQDVDGITATVRDEHGEQTVRAGYAIGCDGAHSTVRKQLGIAFTGDALPEEYMLADVEVDWDLPVGYSVRSIGRADDGSEDPLVCIPLPGDRRYRMSMRVPPELSTATAKDGVAHGLEGGRAPELHHVQAVVDRLSPRPATVSTMRWSSVFRISHRIVDRYGAGRAFVAGDAAHIHPPTGAQGMNTGIQDAINLAWKVALAVRGKAAPGLLDSYDAERRPIGEEVVARTVRAVRQGVGAGETDVAMVIAREAQLLVGYPDSPLVAEGAGAEVLDGGPAAGARAADARGLGQDFLAGTIRLHDLFRHTGHTLLLWARDARAAATQRRLIEAVPAIAAGHLRAYVIVGRDADLPDISGMVLRDEGGEFAKEYATGHVETAAYLVRPDGYVGFRTTASDAAAVLLRLRAVLRV